MDKYITDVLTHSRDNPRKLLIDASHNLAPIFENPLTKEFLILSSEQLKNYTKSIAKDFIFLAWMQSIMKDLITLKTQPISDFMKQHFLNNGDVFDLRSPMRHVFIIKGLPLFGSKEPFESKFPTLSTHFHAAKLRFMMDILKVDEVVVFESRNFKQEEKLWTLIQQQRNDGNEKKIQLIEIADWSLPTTNALVAFAHVLNKAQQTKHTVLAHCIAGNGRTGICLMFIFMFQLQIFDFVVLLIKLAENYKKKAAIEIITIVQRHRINLHQAYNRFIQAYYVLQKDLNFTLFPKINHIPSNKYGFRFDEKQLTKLLRAGIVAKVT